MAYFSNCCEGAHYEESYCHKCIHQLKDDGSCCTILTLHYRWNSDSCGATLEAKAKADALNALIPRSQDGLSNEQCTMFHQVTP